MAIPHLNVSIITRSRGQSAVAAAAYRSACALYNEQDNKTHDYTRKQDVRYTEILAPPDAPAWTLDRAILWRTVEAGERRKDARFARSLTLALPRELNLQQNRVLVANFARENFVSEGMIADLAIHTAKASDGGQNPHAHILLTLRDIDASGFGKKNRDWDHVKRLESWRDAWESSVNRSMAEAGIDASISMKSYAEQGIDKIPTKHLGPDAWQVEQQGIETQVGDENRKIKLLNRTRESVQYWLEGEPWLEEGLPEAEILTETAGEMAGTEDAASQVALLRKLADETISQAPETAKRTKGREQAIASYRQGQENALNNFARETTGGQDDEGVATAAVDSLTEPQADHQQQHRLIQAYFRKTIHYSSQGHATFLNRFMAFSRQAIEVGQSLSGRFSAMISRIAQEAENLKERGNSYER